MDVEHPLDARACGVSSSLPRRDFAGEGLCIGDPSIEALPTEDGDEEFCDDSNSTSCRLVEGNDRTLAVGALAVEVEHILHPHDEFGVDGWDAPHLPTDVPLHSLRHPP